jgi:hypothetical protein
LEVVLTHSLLFLVQNPYYQIEEKYEVFMVKACIHEILYGLELLDVENQDIVSIPITLSLFPFKLGRD